MFFFKLRLDDEGLCPSTPPAPALSPGVRSQRVVGRSPTRRKRGSPSSLAGRGSFSRGLRPTPQGMPHETAPSRMGTARASAQGAEGGRGGEAPSSFKRSLNGNIPPPL